MARILAVVLCLISVPAQASSCKTIRYYIARYGEEAAINWALSHGYSQTQIERLRRECLNEHR